MPGRNCILLSPSRDCRLVVPFGTALALLLAAGGMTVAAEDLVEFRNGAKVRGTIKEIRKEEKEFDVEVVLGGRTLLRTFTFDKVLAVTMKGKRYQLSKATHSGSAGVAIKRSRAEVLQLINSVGRTPPDWLANTKLEYPPTLNLHWPLNPETKGWNNQKNMGQYKWDIINPNPARWRSGVRLLNKVMSLHKDEPQLLQRDMKALAEMHFELFQDYPRAAFWLRQSQVKPPQPQAINLAECYWRLGNEQMALEAIKSKRLPMNTIKLLGDMRLTDRAIKLAESFGRSIPDRAHEPYLLAGDACRLNGRYDEAIDFYKRVMSAGKARNENYQKIYVGRARDSIEAIELFDQADVSQVADGAYRAASTGYNGALEVEVTVAGGEIERVQITKHREKQFYAALTDTPRQLIKKQSVKDIDATSRATITSQAIVNATAKALAKGAR